MTATAAPELLVERLRRAAEITAANDYDSLIITPSSDLRYLTGSAITTGERLTCLVVPASGQNAPPTIVVPRLEAPGLDHAILAELGIELVTWSDDEDPYELTHRATGGARRVAVSDFMPARHLFGLRGVHDGAGYGLAGRLTGALRATKDAAEIAQLRAAGAAIDEVHARMRDLLQPGRTEAQVSRDIAAVMIDAGHATADFVIVGSGPNGASPHHQPSARAIGQGDIVVVDIGGPMPNGYNSDCTRTYSIGDPDARIAELYTVLQQAQAAAVAAVAPGTPAGDIDRTARSIIDAAGLGGNFIHRTGHGIGLDVHEDPYIVAENRSTLRPGMAFSVEPGIYFDGEWGARIEDIVVVTDDGAETLNNRPRELTVL